MNLKVYRFCIVVSLIIAFVCFELCISETCILPCALNCSDFSFVATYFVLKETSVLFFVIFIFGLYPSECHVTERQTTFF